MGTVFPWVGKGSHHIKEGGWLCVNKTRLLLNILKHDLKSDLQSCCQETEEVSCLFYKLPVFSPLPACPGLTGKHRDGWQKGSLLPKIPKTEAVGRLSPLPATCTSTRNCKTRLVPRVPDEPHLQHKAIVIPAPWAGIVTPMAL